MRAPTIPAHPTALPPATRRPCCIKLLLGSYYLGYWIRRLAHRGVHSVLIELQANESGRGQCVKAKGVCFSCVWCHNIPVQEMTVRPAHPSQSWSGTTALWTGLNSTTRTACCTRMHIFIAFYIGGCTVRDHIGPSGWCWTTARVRCLSYHSFHTHVAPINLPSAYC